MENRLYVTNLSGAASLTSLRQCFATCGEVAEIEFAAERQAQKGTPSAFVTMATAAGAQEAVRRLHGTSLDGRSLMVSLLPQRSTGMGRAENRERSDKKGAATGPSSIAITLQYRERHNMTYELDCAGARLILRIFFPAETGQLEWRIEARSRDGGEVCVEKAAPTRELALKEVSEAWQALPADPALPSFDWQAVARAMQAVRAI